MTMTLIADAPVDVDAEGFLTDPEQWNETIANGIARENGIPELTDRHWLVVRFMRERYLATGMAPSIRALGKESGVPIKELYQLFPKGPAKLAAKIGGIPSRRAASRKEHTMTELLEHPQLMPAEPETIEKVSIVISKGSLEGIYPGLIMANGARMEGIEANLFFTFFGLDAIRRDRFEKIKVATVGNPGMHLPTWLGAIPGFSALATRMMKRQMEKIDIPPIPEFVELVADSGAHLYACKATVDMFGLTMDDFVPQVEEIISVGEFYEKAGGGQIIFT